MKNIVKFSCVVVLGFAATACGSDTKTSSSTAAATTAVAVATTSAGTPASSAAPTTTVASTTAGSTETSGASAEAGVQLVDSSLGKILADADGNILYMFAKDTATTSACTDACAAKWPALAGPVEPGAGLDDDDFATITGADGTQQATFYGHPLYHFSGDNKPGDTNGQGVGGIWYVMDDEGNAVGADATSTTAAGGSGVAEVTTTTAYTPGY